MSSTYTSRIRLEMQGPGDDVGTWGTRLNAQLQCIDDATNGVVTVAVNSNVTLSSGLGVTDQSRSQVLKFTGVGGFEVTIPGVEKFYITHNTCTDSVTIKTASAAGASIQPGAITFIYCDGTYCYSATYTGSTTFTRKIIAVQSTTGTASINLPQGTAPDSPDNGDFWTSAAGGLKYHIDGLTLGPSADLIASGTLASNSSLVLALPGSFRAYELLLSECRPDADGFELLMRVSTDGGGTYNFGPSDYEYGFSTVDSIGTAYTQGETKHAISLTTGIRGTSAGATVRLMIDRPSQVFRYKPISFDASYIEPGSRVIALRGGGVYVGGTGQITHIMVFAGFGSMSGSYALSGRR